MSAVEPDNKATASPIGSRSSTWRKTRLGELVSIKHGWPFKSKHYREGTGEGPVVVAVGNFRYEGGFRFDETKVNEYEGEYPADYELAPGDILLIMTCQTSGGEILGVPGKIPNDGRVYLHNQRLGKVEIRDEAEVDAAFLYYLFRSHQFNAALFATASGSKILHTAPKRIEAFEFELPPLDEQRRIAAILGSLDDKTEHNRRTAQSLERLARAIFKAWFVDFEPVKAKAEGATSFPSMPQDVFDALPTTFVDSEIGPVPEGWGIRPISGLASLSKDQLKPTEYPDEVFDHFSLPAFDAARRPVEDLGGSIKSNKFIVKEGSVLLSKLNPRFPRIWLPPSPEERRQIASTEFLVFEPHEAHDRSFLYLMFTQRAFQEVMVQQATGTSTSHQRVKPKDLLKTKVVSAPVEVRRSFDALTRPILKLVGIGQDESDSLAETRDYLLPKLMSGKVSVEQESVV